MTAKKYPVGTKIKYIEYCPKCKGKTGKVVEMVGEKCYITLPQSLCFAFRYSNRMLCPWNEIEPLVVKGQQLLFEFME